MFNICHARTHIADLFKYTKFLSSFHYVKWKTSPFIDSTGIFIIILNKNSPLYLYK